MKKKVKKRNPNFIAYLEGWLSIGINILLFALKYWAGVVSGSVAIIADAWHTLADSITSIIVLIGTKTSEKPPDNKHPFGHGRAEIIAAFIIGVFLAFIAFEFFLESSRRLYDHEAASYGTIAIVVTIISVLLKEALARFAFWSGKKINSISLRADAWHHRSDAISSIIILVGIFLGKYFWWIDGVLGLIVAIIIAYAALKTIKDAISSILGETPSDEDILKIKQICNEVSPFDSHPHHIHIHDYGKHQELTFHINLPSNISLLEAHNIATEIEIAIKKEMNFETTIHMEPLQEFNKSKQK